MIPVAVGNGPPPPPPPVAIPRPSFIKQAWEKICEIAKKIFDFICFWKKPEFILTHWQLSIVDQARLKAQQVIPTPPPKPDFYDLDDEEEMVVKRSPQTVIEDPSLKSLLNSLQGFGSVISECVKSEKIAPSIDGWKEDIARIPETTKQWVKMFLDLKKYLDPVFDKFSNNDDPLFMTLIQLLCTVLLENKSREEIEEDLILKINALQEKKDISEDMHLKLIAAIQPALSWLFQSNNMFLKSINPIMLHNLLIDARNFTVEFSKMLLDGDLDIIIDEIEAIIQENLEESLDHLLDDNNQTISKIIGTRIVDLIQNMSYTETFDDLIVRINTHLEAWISANGKYKEEKKTIFDARDSINFNSPQIDISTKQKLDEYIQIVENEGGDKEYLNKKFIDDFRTVVAGKNPDSVPLLPSSPAGMPQEMVEEEVYGNFADKLYSILLPAGKTALPLDIHIEQDGLADIWEQIALPEMLQEVEKRLLALFETVIKKINPRDEDTFKTYFFLIMKTFVFYYIRENKVIPLIKTGIGRIFEKFSNPTSIQALFSKTILPAVSDKLFQMFIKQVVSSKVGLFAPVFCTLIEAPAIKIVSAKKAVIAKFEEVLEKEFKDFKWNMMDRSRVPALVQPTIVRITEVLKALKAVDPAKTLKNEEVAAAITQLYKEETAKVVIKKEFGEIIGKLLFQIAEYSPTYGWFHSSLESRFAAVGSEGFKDFRTSFHSMVNTIINVGPDTFLKEGYVRDTFFGNEGSLEEIQEREQEVRQNLPDQFLGISAQTHDLLYWTPETKTLDGIVQRIFKKIFKRKLINKSLVFQFFKVLDKALEDSVIRTGYTHQLQQRVQLISGL